MRAPPYRSYNKLVVFVSGYYDGANVSVKKSTTSDGGSNSSAMEENLHWSPSESNLDMEWDSEGGVEYAEFPATFAYRKGKSNWVHFEIEKVHSLGRSY